MRTAVAIALVLLTASACGSRGSDSLPSPVPAAAANGAALPDAPELAELTCDGLERHLVPGYESRAALARVFGSPEGVDVSTEPNRHVVGAIDSLFVVRYPGLTAQFRRPEGGDDLTSFLSVIRSDYLRYPSIGIGAEADRVTDVLGAPGASDAERLVYDCGRGPSQPVHFRLSDGSVEGIEITYYVD